MTLEQLKYLHAIVEHGSFRAAADAVYRSQSSLSISIQKLEQEFGIQIFAREGYRPELTDAGKVIYQKGKHLLEKSHELHDFVKHLASGCEAEIRLAISGIVPIEPIIHVLNQIAIIYPETRMNILIENLNGTMERISDGDADIAITDALEFKGQWEYLPLTDIAFVSVVPSSSVWAQQANSLSEQDLEKETLIVVRDTSHHSPRISKGILTGSPQWVVNDFATKQRIICSGKGWGRMPLHLVADDIKQGRLTMLTSQPFQKIYAPVNLVRKKNRPSGPVEQALWAALKQIQWT